MSYLSLKSHIYQDACVSRSRFFQVWTFRVYVSLAPSFSRPRFLRVWIQCLGPFCTKSPSPQHHITLKQLFSYFSRIVLFVLFHFALLYVLIFRFSCNDKILKFLILIKIWTTPKIWGCVTIGRLYLNNLWPNNLFVIDCLRPKRLRWDRTESL